MKISVIIPTLNEARHIERAIRQVRVCGDCEIVVVDGGSTDGTLERATQADVAIAGPQGRALQQNCGAASSHGDILLFLHADCELQPGCLEAIETGLQNPRVVGGCFYQRIHAQGILYRSLEWGNAIRVRLAGWAYGDQGIFVRRCIFERLGGFPELPLMEDLYFSKRLKREGLLRLLRDPPLRVSARRWQQNGVLRQTVRNWFLIGLTALGVSPSRLVRMYPHVR
ncbi:MAG: TIGR04283 family arsenosugar biosynthesis glycosyltransferase [Planctomycetaceae bacterium]